MNKHRDNFLRMLFMVWMFALIVSFVNVQNTQATAKKKNTVVLYFSATGTTRETAKKIGKAAKGSVTEIKAKNSYTEDDIDYTDSSSRVSKEHASAKTPAESRVRPAISNINAIKKAVKKADVMYISDIRSGGARLRISSTAL